MLNTRNASAETLQGEISELEERAQMLAQEIERGPGGREVAIAITSLQVARLWLGEAILKD